VTISPPQVYLDVKYAYDPEIKFNIVILPALEGSHEEQPPAYFGFEAFSNFSTTTDSFPQNPAYTGPSAPPPPYMSYGAYPSLSGFDGKA